MEIKDSTGSKETNKEPKVIKEVLNEYFQSNEPLAVAYRNRMMYPNTEPCVDLKLLTREPGRMAVGDHKGGIITCDEEGHYTFVENTTEKKKGVVQRNPPVFEGKCINITRRDDGSLYPTFNRPHYSSDFTFQDLCREAAEELIAVIGLIEEETEAEK